jgi:hypothetical protein
MSNWPRQDGVARVTGAAAGGLVRGGSAGVVGGWGGGGVLLLPAGGGWGLGVSEPKDRQRSTETTPRSARGSSYKKLRTAEALATSHKPKQKELGARSPCC